MNELPIQTVTIKQVAQRAGVSLKTVSRVINNDPNVAAKTRQRVQAVIAELGFVPNSGARNLRSRQRDTLGVMLPAPMNVVPLSRQMLAWLFAETYRCFGYHGKFVSFDLNPYSDSGTEDYARGLWQDRYGASVLAGPLALGDKVVARIQALGRPYVSFGRLESVPDLSYAVVDYEEAAYVSTRYFIERGHKRIGMLKGFQNYFPGLERRRGYSRAMAEAGLDIDEQLIRPVSFSTNSMITATHRLLLDQKTTAIIDASAAEDADSLREGGKRAGRLLGPDCEVLSWTYTANAAVLSEACAHVWLPVREAASEGMEELRRWWDEAKSGPIQIVYRPTLYEQATNGVVSKPEPVFTVPS